MSVIQISAKDLQKKIENGGDMILLDVREPNEFEFAHIEGSLLIPTKQIPQRIEEIDSVVDCVVICHHGMRSQQVAVFLSDSGFSNIHNLSGGIDVWSVECDNTVLRY
ncbi:MAG: rhodanese [Methylococcales bacterium]|nr:rhodanese [Methylococcales bacterium]